jgi:hypothetical protein
MTCLDNWVTVPTNSILTIHKQTVMIHPIIDEYYNHSPSYLRSSGFAVSKGLVSSTLGATAAPAVAGARGPVPATDCLTPVVGEDDSMVPAVEGQSRELSERLHAVLPKIADVGA